MKILFLVPYPLRESPSQRFRFEQYIEIVRDKGHFVQVQSFLDSPNWKQFYTSGGYASKALTLLRGFSKRVLILFNASSFDFIFIHREAAPLGPPVIEWILARILRKKIIYDFDDAIWLTDRADEPGWLKLLKWRSKVKLICTWSHVISCGNDFLCEFARQANPRVVYNPTTIDTESVHNPEHYSKKESDEIVVGWTGSHSTLKYLKDLEVVLQKLEEENKKLRIVVIADQPDSLSLKTLTFIPWSKETELEDLMKIDIGIMPLPDDEWSKGKCGFKALQYMALRIPAVVSSVGANRAIVDDGVNGFLCSSGEEWRVVLQRLIGSKSLQSKMGEAGRKKVIDQYSVCSNSSRFLSLFT
jgi:glycosyltransferase involved in cell wall biosynthesis